MLKGVFEVNKNSNDPDQPAGIHSLIRNFARLRYVIHYPIILQADSEGPDQTAPMSRLIWAFTVRICPKVRFCMARPTQRRSLSVCDAQSVKRALITYANSEDDDETAQSRISS